MRLVGWIILITGAVLFCYAFTWYEYVVTLILVIMGTALAVEKEEEE